MCPSFAPRNDEFRGDECQKTVPGHGTVWALVVRHNDASPPNRLPPEILGEIFRSFLGNNCSDYVIHLTHVCRNWRAVALADVKLWCKPSIFNPALVKEIIRRNQNTGLYLDIRYDGRSHRFCPYTPRCRNWVKSVRTQFAHMEHTVSAKLCMDAYVVRLWKIYDIHRPAPLLESLEIHDARFFDEYRVKEQDLFQGCVPRLKRLLLRNYEKLLVGLQSAPLLERLVLSDLRAECRQGKRLGLVRDHGHVVPLRHLRELSISHSHLDACIHLIIHLDIDQPARVHLDDILYNIPHQDLPPAAHAICCLLTRDLTALPRPASINVTTNVVLDLWDNVAADGYPPEDRAGASTVRILTGMCMHSTRTWYRHLPLTNVHALHVALSSSWCIEDVPAIFGPMDQVEALYLGNDHAMNIITMLATRRRTKMEGRSGLFLRLQRLTLHPKTPVFKTASMCQSKGPAPRHKTFSILNNLEEYVRERHEEGVPILELCFHAESFLNFDVAKKFQKFVQSIVVC